MCAFMDCKARFAVMINGHMHGVAVRAFLRQAVACDHKIPEETGNVLEKKLRTLPEEELAAVFYSVFRPG